MPAASSDPVALAPRFALHDAGQQHEGECLGHHEQRLGHHTCGPEQARLLATDGEFGDDDVYIRQHGDADEPNRRRREWAQEVAPHGRGGPHANAQITASEAGRPQCTHGCCHE